MEQFDLKKFIVENKLTANSKILNENKSFKASTIDVNISVTIKNNKLIDTDKVQQYIDELGESIQSHINKGN